MSSPEFESIGTIHYKVSKKKDSLLFIPDSNHSLKYSGTSYAVFVKLRHSDKKPSKARVVPLRKRKDRGISLEKYVLIKISSRKKMRDVLRVVRRAAGKQASVTVRVKRKSESSIKLMGITFPTR